MDEQIDKILRNIEKLEKTWSYVLSDENNKKHSYGRTDQDKNELRFWSVPHTTGQFLRFLILSIKPKTILELGTSAGYSTLWMASAAKHFDSRIYTIEVFPAKIELAKRHFKEASIGDLVSLIEGDIKDILASWNKGKIDFIFMDADKHDYVDYYDAVMPILNSGGTIVADNAVNFGNLMKPFLEKAGTDPRVITNLLELDNGLLLIYKK